LLFFVLVRLTCRRHLLQYIVARNRAVEKRRDAGMQMSAALSANS
jgi:hypothetical protein